MPAGWALTTSTDVPGVEAEDLRGHDAIVHMAELSNDPTGELAPNITYDINHHGSVRLAQLAKRHGLGYQLGCQVGETAILSAAGRHFATSVADLRHVEGSYDRHLVWERLSVEDITFSRRGGRAPALVGCGLGITVDPARVDWVTVRKEKLIG